jgi:hypothetical protein
MEIGFDIIGDLFLGQNDSLNWENKATSLYCIITGNVSGNTRTLAHTLIHLSKFYQGIFYVPGLLEYQGIRNTDIRTKEITEICSAIPNVALLYHHVVTIDGIALLGANGWSADKEEDIDNVLVSNRLGDIAYLNKSVAKLQTHLDVQNIIIITNAIPTRDLYFGQIPTHTDTHIYPDFCLKSDTEFKISHWVFGTSNKIVDTRINNINYVNNPYFKKRPYWPKRISINV